MSDNKPKPQPAGGSLLLIGLVVYFMFFHNASSPDTPQPDTPPGPVPALSTEIAVALQTIEPAVCEQYAGFYAAAADYISRDGAISKQRDHITATRKALGLQSTPEFGVIVGRVLQPFAEGAVDRTAYAAALRSLCDGCRYAARKGK